MSNLSEFARLSAIVTSSDDAIISKDFDGIIKTWNNAATTIFGFTPREALGRHISIIIPEEFREEEKNHIAEIKKGFRVKNYETIRQRKDNTTFPASITMSPITDAETNVIGASIIVRDLTEQRLIEHNESLLASIINSSDDAIVSKNTKGIITSWNRGAQQIFGFSEEEAVGKHISIIIPEFKLDEEAKIIAKILRGEKIDHIETIRKTRDGREINVSITISPIRDRSKRIIGASKIARDITQKKEIEKQKQLYIKKLQKLNDYKDDFMMMASHELKTPLTVIKANLQVLRESIKSSGSDISYVDKALNHVDKLSTLISELMDVSKIQNGKLDLNITSFNLTLLLEEIIADMQNLSSAHKIILNHPAKLLEIKADRERIRQVLVNMLNNAIKYSPGGNVVYVKTSVKDSGIIITIKDNGIGISGEDIDKIFTRFYRAGGIASTFSGAGIGLYISSEIIKHHGGKMWVESQLDKGSVFYIEIPRQISNTLGKAI